MTALEQFLLLEAEFLAIGHTYLLLNQVNAHNLLGYRVLHLQTGVHFEEIEVAILVDKKLNSSCTTIVNGLGGCPFRGGVQA